MNETGFFRGHKMEYRDGAWFYMDTGEAVAKTWRDRPCGVCGLPNTPEGHDGCIGTIPGAMNACCGHGRPNEAYIQYPAPLSGITEEMVERIVEDRVGLIQCECPSCDGSGLNSDGRQDAEAGFTPDPDSTCEKCNGEGWIREMPYCDPDEIKDDLIALLRQQVAERKWISVDGARVADGTECWIRFRNPLGRYSIELFHRQRNYGLTFPYVAGATHYALVGPLVPPPFTAKPAEQRRREANGSP